MATRLAHKYSIDPTFAKTVLDEADVVLGGVRGALLTIKDGDATANAGVDRKNSPSGSYVLWPRHPDKAARTIRNSIVKRFGKNIGVIIVDSRVTPMRLGTIGFAIGSSGFRVVEDARGKLDLHRRRIEITFQAIADGLAATAQLVMGEASERTPFALIRGAPARFEMGNGIESAKLAREKCVYMSQVHRSHT